MTITRHRLTLRGARPPRALRGAPSPAASGFFPLWTCLLLGAFFAATLAAPGQTLRLLVLTGQSNSLGTPATTENTMAHPRPGGDLADTNVPFFWDNTADDTPAGDAALGDSGGQWSHIGPQRGGYYPHSAAHWGPEVGCARELWAAGYRDFGIIKVSRGGGGNSDWCPTNATHFLYDKLVNTVRSAVRALPPGCTNFQIAGLLYLQGESDSPTEAGVAGARFELLLASLQHDLPHAAGMKAVIGEIARDTTGTRRIVSQQQAALAARRPDLVYASSAGLTRQNVDGLNLHYDADSLIVMGERMAREAVRVGMFAANAVGGLDRAGQTTTGAAQPLNAKTLTAPVPESVYAWYAGDLGLAVGVNNYSVTTWTNLATAATNLTYTAAGRNLVYLTGAPQKSYLRSPGGAALGAVTFGGTDGIWAAKSAFGIITNNRTIIVYARVRNANPEGFLFDSTSTTPGYTRALVWSNHWQISATSGAGTITAPATTNVWQVHSFVISTNAGNATFQHFTNGVLAGSAPVGLPGYLSGLMIGANVAQAYGIPADVAECLVFNAALTTAARTNVEAYLTAKWAGVVADTNAPPPPTPYVATAIFTSGTSYPEYRIPALVTTTNGTLIAVADGRQSNGDIPNPIDCVCRCSLDNGNTWGPLQVIADYGSNTGGTDMDTYPAYGITNPVPRRCAGDSSLLLDRTNGRVWLLYDNGAPATNGFNSATRAIKLEMRYSDDNGTTWSPRLDVEALNPGLRPSIQAAPEFLTGPGNGVQLAAGIHAGRLIFPVYVAGNPYYSALIYSDNHGATWQTGGTAGLGGGEIQIAETAGGGLLASMRDATFSWNGVRTFSRSSDGGLTWGALATTFANPGSLPDPACQASLLRLTTANDSNSSRLVFANCDSSSSRVAMTLRLSYDEGQTWPVSNLVYSGMSGYSALAKLATGEIGLLNEVNNYARIDYVRRSVTTVSGGADALPPYTVWAGTQFTPAQLLNPAIASTNADPDGDKFSNYQEFVAGTNPLDATSYLHLDLVPPAAATNAWQFSLAAVSNKTYTVQWGAVPAPGSWQKWQDLPAAATNAVWRFPLTPTNAARYFRVVTPQSP